MNLTWVGVTMSNRDSDYIQFCADVSTELYSAQALLRAVQKSLTESAHHAECEHLVDAGLLLPMLEQKINAAIDKVTDGHLIFRPVDA